MDNNSHGVQAIDPKDNQPSNATSTPIYNPNSSQATNPNPSSCESEQEDDVFGKFAETLNHNQSLAVLEYTESFCKDIYNAELERENSILQQASNMQGAFSFVTAGLFVIAQIVTDNRGENTPYWLIIASFGIITFFLVLSLIFATRAQKRMTKKMGFPSIEDFVKYATDKSEEFICEESRILLTIQEYNGMYKSLRNTNEKRISHINKSMLFFYLAIAASIIGSVALIWSDWHCGIN